MCGSAAIISHFVIPIISPYRQARHKTCPIVREIDRERNFFFPATQTITKCMHQHFPSLQIVFSKFNLFAFGRWIWNTESFVNFHLIFIDSQHFTPCEIRFFLWYTVIYPSNRWNQLSCCIEYIQCKHNDNELEWCTVATIVTNRWLACVWLCFDPFVQVFDVHHRTLFICH